MGDKAGQRGEAGDGGAREHVGGVRAVEEGEVAFVRHGCEWSVRIGGLGGACRTMAAATNGGSSDTRDLGGGRLVRGGGAGAGGSWRAPAGRGRVGRGMGGYEGGLGIMKEAAVEAPDG
jgi:hypothetical protein